MAETEIVEAEIVVEGVSPTPGEDSADSTPSTAQVVAVPPTSALVEPVADIDRIETAYRNYQNLVARLLDDDDYQQVRGKRFVKKSGWRKLSVAMGVSIEVVSIDTEHDEQGRVSRCTVQARATAPNGRSMDGVGACSLSEARFKHDKARADHDIPATAETRAKNRACSDLFGFGEVSAEEMQGQAEHDDYYDHGMEVERKATLREDDGSERPASDKQIKMIRARLAKAKETNDIDSKHVVFPDGWFTSGLPRHSSDLTMSQIDRALELIDQATTNGQFVAPPEGT